MVKMQDTHLGKLDCTDGKALHIVHDYPITNRYRLNGLWHGG